ncbi:MAG: hypothetical protein QMD53_01705 [Actinomycetota bacterium]|nr:hypothetical protein [Actinomycetota bacterium]
MLLRGQRLFLVAIFIIFLTALPLNKPVFSSPIGDAKDRLDSINEQLKENEKLLEETKKKESGLLGEITK